MSDYQDDGSISISGAFGEVYFIDPSNTRAPRRIFEITGFQAAEEESFVDVPLAGNEQGSKTGPMSRAGSFTVRKVDDFFENLVADQRPETLAARRAARDAGTRRSRKFTLQVIIDDPDAMGKLGYEVTGVQISRRQVAFDITQAVSTVEHPFRFDELRRLHSFEIISSDADPQTGLPKIRKITPDNSALPTT